jgi:two-component system OmpR family sensor kinase
VKRWSLSTRLIVGIVGLLVVLAAAIGSVTVTTLRGQLVARLDNVLLAASQRTTAFVDTLPGTVAPAVTDSWSIVQLLSGQGAGAILLVSVDGEPAQAGYIGVNGEELTFSAEQLSMLSAVPDDRLPRTLDLGNLGDYRVVATPIGDTGVVAVNGLSLREADATTASLISTIAGVSLGAIVVAVLLGSLLVRVALRPLTRVVETAARVSELPLESGEVSLGERVPDADTAPSTEVGRVGAALNRLLGKVEASLAARHESEQKLRRFVADASHELRTPLASIRGYAELGRRAARLPADTARALERIESESVRMTTLVEEMMLLARLDAGRDLRAEPVSLGALLVEAVSDAHAAGPDYHWELELPDTDVEVTGDPDRLRQAIANLLANARLHTPAGTTVIAALGATGDGAAVTVSDDGPGIAPSRQPNLFERFTRGDDSRSRLSGSTGLGLAIVAAIVAAHGGTVSVASEPGHTVFRIELPATVAAVEGAAVEGAALESSPADPEPARN